MRDPHVERLHFEIWSGEGTSYKNPEPQEFDNSLGHFLARDGRLTVEPVDHFADKAAALAVVEPFLRGWEIATDLDANPATIRFRLIGADVIDRNPPPPGSPIVLMAAAGSITLSGTVAKLTVTHRRYPEPPRSFQVTSDVLRAHARWLEYRAGREPLQSMGYFVLDLVETSAGDRKRAAVVYGVHRAVLSKVGELTSTRGSAVTARKVPPSGTFRELEGAEKAWLEQAIRRIVKRLGEHASGDPCSPLTMSDLPPI